MSQLLRTVFLRNYRLKTIKILIIQAPGNTLSLGNDRAEIRCHQRLPGEALVDQRFYPKIIPQDQRKKSNSRAFEMGSQFRQAQETPTVSKEPKGKHQASWRRETQRTN